MKFGQSKFEKIKFDSYTEFNADHFCYSGRLTKILPLKDIRVQSTKINWKIEKNENNSRQIKSIYSFQEFNADHFCYSG